MSDKIPAWKQLEDVRVKELKVRKELEALQELKERLTKECRVWLYGPVSTNLSAAETRVVNVFKQEPLGNKIIADRLNISERTVKFHFGQIFQKMNVNNRTDLFALLQEIEKEKLRYADSV